MTQYVVPYTPRECYQPFHEAGKRWTLLVAHRRSGKTYSMLAEGLKRALLGPANGLYHYVAPYYGQAKAIAWDILSYLTRDVAVKRSEVELWVELPNGSRLRLFGADRPDAMRGLRCHGLLNDEYADHGEDIYQTIHRPMLADTGGWAIFAGTPKGRNHFWELLERARLDDQWHVEVLPVSKTGLISDEELAQLANEMTPEVYAQEFECSFVAPRSGSIWGEVVERLRAGGRIRRVEHDPSLPVEIATDLGFTDSTACWYWQTGPDGFGIIDYDEYDQRPADWWVRYWQAKGYEYETIWLPHDARAKSFQTGKSTIELLLAYDLPVRIGPEAKKQDGINAVRMMAKHWYMDEQQCKQGISRLANYRYKWNPKTKAYSLEPLHDENSHGADAARYMALVQEAKPGRFRPEKPAAAGIDKRFQLEVLFDDRERHRPGGAAGMGW